jgi:hypothetical protein
MLASAIERDSMVVLSGSFESPPSTDRLRECIIIDGQTKSL